jgi:hypothetical protein
MTTTFDPRDLEPELLLAIARGAVAERFGATQMVIPERPWLSQPAATFVTINNGEQLHGCIGSIEPRRPLVEDLRHNAVMAAFHDPRTRALRPDEFEWVRFSISILGPRSPLSFHSEEDARRQLRPHVDGLVLHYDGREGHRGEGHRGVFLPKVWEMLPESRSFLDNLKRKAGLPSSFWSMQVRLERFEVIAFEEPKLPAGLSAHGWHH